MLMKRLKIINQANLYILLWCIYYLQGTIYTSGGFLSQFIIFILLIWSIYNSIFLNIHFKLPVYFKGLNALILMFVIYGLYLIISNDIIIYNYQKMGNINYLKAILLSLLPIYSAYLFTIKGQLTQSHISKWIFIWLIIATTSFYRYQQEELANLLGEQTETTNNMSYMFLALMPVLVVYYKKNILQILIMLYCMSYVVMGMKRGAILIGILIFIYFLYQTYKNSSKKTKKYVIIFFIFTIIYFVYFISDMIDSSDYFNQRIEQTIDGNSSSRDLIYEKFWNHFLNETNIYRFLFGYGAWGTIKIGNAVAHNDWLEILINNGLIGVIIYVFYWICFIKSFLMSRINTIAFSAIGMMLVISFMLTLFSMSYGSLEIYFSLSLGYFLACAYKKCN